MPDWTSKHDADLKTVKEIVTAKLTRQTLQNDKTMLMERTIQLVATMPNKSKRQEVLTNIFIDQLWNSLDHPPLLYMGNEFKYRQADGSNNVWFFFPPFFYKEETPSQKRVQTEFSHTALEPITTKARRGWHAVFSYRQAWTGQHGVTTRSRDRLRSCHGERCL